MHTSPGAAAECASYKACWTCSIVSTRSCSRHPAISPWIEVWCWLKVQECAPSRPSRVCTPAYPHVSEDGAVRPTAINNGRRMRLLGTSIPDLVGTELVEGAPGAVAHEGYGFEGWQPLSCSAVTSTSNDNTRTA
jgi:hypothetical protein